MRPPLLPPAPASRPGRGATAPVGAAALICALVVAAGLLAGCQKLFPHRSQGEELYRKHCSECHGLDGRGNTVRAMGQPYADLTDDTWKNGSDDTSIGNSIREGSFGLMPGFQETLDDQQIQALVAYLRVLQHSRAAAQ